MTQSFFKSKFLVGLLVSFALSGTTTAQKTAAEDSLEPHEALVRLIEEVNAYYREDTSSPLPEGTDPRYKDRFPHRPKAFYVNRAEKLKAFRQRLAAIERADLSRSGRIDFDVLALRLRNRLGEIQFGAYLVPITNREGFHIGFARVPENRPFLTVEDYDDYIAKLQSYREYTHLKIELMKEGLAKGMALPKIVLDGYEETISGHIVENITDSVFYKPFRALPDHFSEEDRVRILRDGPAAIAESVIPAYRDFFTFMVETYLPRAPTQIGISRMAEGAAFYAHRIRRFTTLELSPKEVNDIGLQEVKRLRTEMQAIIDEVKFQGGFREFLDFLRTDPRFYVQEPVDYITEAAYIAKLMDGQLAKLFKTLPSTPYGLKPIPDFIAAKTTGAFYDSGRPSSRAGHYFLNLSKLPSRPLFVLEALTFHEAVPGHHLQIMLLKENEDIPAFRRDDSITVFTEGWALYAERLGLEVGFYTDPYSNFGRLTYEIWRACRLVVDTGIHAMDWTRQQAIDYMAANTALSIHEITTEVDRYISWPGQALAYKIGELKITELRRRAEQELGDRFDIRDFHEAVLRNGSIPLANLEQEIEAYIQETQAAPHTALTRLIEEVRGYREKKRPLPVPNGTDPRYHDRMPDLSPKAFQQRLQALSGFQDRLQNLNSESLNGEDRLNATILGQQLRDEIDAIRFKTHLMPISSREGFHVDFARVPQNRVFRSVSDYDGYIARLQSFLPFVRGQIAFMKEGVKEGLVLPRAVLQGFEGTVQPLLTPDIHESRFFKPLKKLPKTLAKKDRERLRADGERALTESVFPAYREFLAFMVGEYIPACRKTIGASKLPRGRAYYAHRILAYTTLDMKAEDIHRIGKEEVFRLREEMTKVMSEAGFEGSLEAFLQSLREDSRFYVETPEDYLKKAAYIAKRMDGQLPNLFKQLPRSAYGLRSIPDFIAARASSGYYDRGAEDGTRAGMVNLNTSALSGRPTYLLEALTFHEGAPGHHLQIMLARENPKIPAFRKSFGLPAYVEGWALYAERLGKEVGFYTDPYSDFGRLTYEIWRACRLVVDTGIHAMGWSREQARAYLRTNTALSDFEINAEVDRYISEPGQALSYKMGELKFTALRKKAETKLGPAFDVRDFHQAVLEKGAVPLDYLDKLVDDYVREAVAGAKKDP